MRDYVTKDGDHVTAKGLNLTVEFGERTKAEIMAKVEEVRDENAKLREQVTQLQDDLESERDYADQMEVKEKKAVGENAKLRDAMYSDAKRHGLQHMDADELRIWATQQADYIERLRCFMRDVWPFVEAGRDNTCVMARCFMFDECCLDESDGYECPAMMRMEEVVKELGVLDK